MTSPGPGGGDIVWRPSADIVENSTLTAFLRANGLADFEALLAKSAAEPAWYWDVVIRHFGIRFHRPYETVMDLSEGNPWARWCVGGTTNLVLNCLDAHLGSEVMEHPAVVWEAENGEVRTWTYAELNAETCRLAEGLRSLGLGKGDRIALYLPMLPETAAAFFAIVKIGGIALPLFSGFGAEAAASRLNDAEAVAVITADGTRRRGKTVPLKRTMDEAAEQVPSLRHVVVLNSLGLDIAWTPRQDRWWHELTAGKAAESPTEEMPADDPFMILFTSGTTGTAKGTIHTHCGFITKVAADFGLCMDFKADDRMLWMSDLGWLVGPMQLVLTAFFGATLVLAEGTPDYPEPGRLWRLIQDHGVSYLGVAPTIARAMMQHGAPEVEKYDLSSLRITVSSGELWNPDSWMWFADHVCKGRVPLLNVSGGTEIGWGIVTNTVLQPHKPCAFSGPVPGMGADIVDASGKTVLPGRMGELVLRQPSIGLTRGLWNDPERYLKTYWNTIPGLWVHGDWASRDEDGMWYLHGRSDDTIMVAGKRCGPSEVEALLMNTGKLAEAAAVGVPDALKGETLICACVPKPDVVADEHLAAHLRDSVVKGLGAAFRPRQVVFVSDLPKTRNMKVMRRVVRAVYEGKDPGDLAALVNPEAVAELRDRMAAIHGRA